MLSCDICLSKFKTKQPLFTPQSILKSKSFLVLSRLKTASEQPTSYLILFKNNALRIGKSVSGNEFSL